MQDKSFTKNLALHRLSEAEYTHHFTSDGDSVHAVIDLHVQVVLVNSRDLDSDDVGFICLLDI
jgi:hypothetical protein